MGLFARLADLVAANLNALLDKVENPERMLAQIVREMEEGLDLARQQAVAVIAGQRRLERELEQVRDAAASWKTRACLALAHGREDLARQALARHLEQIDLVTRLEGQCVAARHASVEAQAAVQALEDRLGQARRHLRLLQTRQEAAQVNAQALAMTGCGNPRSPFARFARLENRLVELEDDLLVVANIASPRVELECELGRLETDQRVAKALAALKEE